MNGKDKCEMLKTVRKQIAEKYGLHYEPTKCNHQGDCAGTCPRCDAELKDLESQLESKGISRVEIGTQINEEINRFREEYVRRLEEQQSDKLIYVTEGMSMPPKEIEQLEGIERHIDELLPPGIPAFEGDVKNIPPSDVTKERKLYKKCFVAGIGFHDIDEIWDELFVGAKLALVRQKDNEHDKNAVAIALADDYEGDPDNFDFDFILGYVPRTENEHIAMMLDMGWSELFECEISKLNEHSSYKERIQIAIYIKSKENVERSTSIRALSLDENNYNKVCRDLETKGCMYFRWGGFPTWQHNLPKKNDNVVFIYKREEYSILYLMHVIAIGDDAYPFVEDKEELQMVDDCCHYVFTNVKGPIKEHNSELKFLDGEEIDDNQPETYLSQEATDLLKMMFNELTQ